MVGTQYQAEVPTGLCHYKDGEKGTAALLSYCSLTAPDRFYAPGLLKYLCQSTIWLTSSHGCMLDNTVYEDDDELLWSPGSIPESKVRSFLSDVLSRTTDAKTGCDKPGLHVRDNEQVIPPFTHSSVEPCYIYSECLVQEAALCFDFLFPRVVPVSCYSMCSLPD